MASSKEYLQFILEQLSGLEEINYRAMMGEYIIYYRGRIAGGIYDDRLLVKPTKSAVSYMTTAIYELPYEGAKEMLLVENVDSKEYLAGLFKAMYDELPVHKSNNKKKSMDRRALRCTREQSGQRLSRRSRAQGLRTSSRIRPFPSRTESCRLQ